MTVVVFKAGIMAADSASWAGSIMVADDVEKVVRINGDLVGCAGEDSDIIAFHDWYRGGCVADLIPKMVEGKHFVALAANQKKVSQITFVKGELNVTDVTGLKDGWVVGCENGFIRGLLAAGKSAVECVEIAIERCAYVGGKAMSLKVDDKAETLLVDPSEPPRVETWRDQYGLGDAAA